MDLVKEKWNPIGTGAPVHKINNLMTQDNVNSLPFAKVREKFNQRPIVNKVVQTKPIIKLKNITKLTNMANEPANMANESANMANEPANMANEPANMANEPANMANEPANMANESANMANEPANMANESANMVNKSFSSKNVYLCEHCGKSFAHRSSLSRHRLHRCNHRGNQDSPKIKLQPKIKEIQQLHEKIATLEQTAKNRDQLLIEQIAKLGDTIQTLSKSQGHQTNITINNVTVFLDQKSLDIYEKKKLIHGSKSALEYLHNTLKNATANTKLNWLQDPEILGDSACPLTIDSKGVYSVQTSPTEIKTCNVTQLNNINNDVITNSVLRAINEVVVPAQKSFDHMVFERRVVDGHFDPIYESPFGHDIYDHLFKYKKIIPTEKHIKSISRLVHS